LPKRILHLILFLVNSYFFFRKPYLAEKAYGEYLKDKSKTKKIEDVLRADGI
jgi:hypothetical protein